jgi:hypothetical protein
MKKEKKQITVIEPRMVFELKNFQYPGDPDDPTTTLATTTFTGLLTVPSGRRQQKR